MKRGLGNELSALENSGVTTGRGSLSRYSNVFHSVKERELYEELKKIYKKVFRCEKCGNLYGSDSIRDNKTCPKCMRPNSFPSSDEDYSGGEEEKKRKKFEREAGKK